MGNRRALVIDAYADEVTAHAKRLGASVAWASFGVVAVAVAAPIGVVVLFFLTALALFQVEGPLNPKQEHALLSRGGLRCIGELSPGGGDQVKLDFSSYPPAGFERHVTVPVSEVTVLPPAALVGRQVRHEGATYQVERVYGTPVGNNVMVLRGADGATKKVALTGECLADP